MAKRTNRMAWGLSGLMALALIGVPTAFSSYGQQTGGFTVRPVGKPYWRYWWVGRGPAVVAACGPHGCSRGTLVGERYGLGFIEVEVPYHGPEVVFWDSFPKSGRSNNTNR